MKKKYLAVILLLICSIAKVNALTIDKCEVLASYKLYSSLDEENYICKGKEYGSSTDAIYYSGSGSKIILNNFDAYYFTNWEEYDVTIDINGNNNISMLRLSDSKFSVTGSGSLKFKQNSFVKKVINGEAVYQYVYQGKTIVDNDKKIYEGIIKEFEENYEHLKEVNKLPSEYNLEDYVLVQVVDYTKMMSVTVTEEWIKQHINTNNKFNIKEGEIIEFEEQDVKATVLNIASTLCEKKDTCISPGEVEMSVRVEYNNNITNYTLKTVNNPEVRIKNSNYFIKLSYVDKKLELTIREK
jgi:hypothetical protein